MYKFIAYLSLQAAWMAVIAFAGDASAQNYIHLILDYEFCITASAEALSTVQSRAIFFSSWKTVLRAVWKGSS